MGDMYGTMAACKLLECSREETAEFQRILREEYERWADGETDDISGFEVKCGEGESAFFHSSCPRPKHLSDAFRRKLAEVLTRLGEPYLEFGVSVTHEGGPDPDAEGGYYFRITDKGELVFAETTWPGAYADAPPEEVDRAQEALERLLEFWDVRQGAAIAALARYLQYRVVRFYECAHCGADLPQEAVETDVGRFCSARCAELEEL